jgi:transcription termination factor NusB
LKNGERARAVLLEEDPSFEYMHLVKDPTNPSSVRYYHCLGDVDLIETLGKDSDNCPGCRVARPGQNATVRMPQQRFGMYIATYQMRNDGKPIVPPVLETVPWIFSQGKVRQINDLIDEYGTVAKDKDVVFVCKNETFQEFEMHVVESLWQKSDEGKEQFNAVIDALPEDTDEQLCKMISTHLTEEQFERLLAVNSSPRASEEDVSEEISKTIADMRASSFDDDDDELDTGAVVNFHDAIRQTNIAAANRRPRV